MWPDFQSAWLAAHCANIKRYRRILESYLTPEERAFVKRRIREEEAAIAHATERLPPETVE